MKINPVGWFANVWKGTAAHVVGDYRAVYAQHPHFLADVAARGFIYTAAPAPRDLFEAGKNEGRRELALEIINTARAPHAALIEMIERAQFSPQGGKS